MHARIDQLLTLRDGEPADADVVQHVESCSSCAAELSRLRQVQRRLQTLEPMEPPAELWQQIRARTAVAQQQRARPGRLVAAIVTGVVITGIGGLIARQSGSPPQFAEQVALPESAAPTVESSRTLDQLVAQSRELDAILQHLPERPAVERVAMAATMDTIEQRIQWLDAQLSYAPDSGLNDAQAYRLWSERVDLMDSLVKVRYAEEQRLSF
jgi:hypothetical protein